MEVLLSYEVLRGHWALWLIVRPMPLLTFTFDVSYHLSTSVFP